MKSLSRKGHHYEFQHYLQLSWGKGLSCLVPLLIFPVLHTGRHPLGNIWCLDACLKAAEQYPGRWLLNRQQSVFLLMTIPHHERLYHISKGDLEIKRLIPPVIRTVSVCKSTCFLALNQLHIKSFRTGVTGVKMSSGAAVFVTGPAGAGKVHILLFYSVNSPLCNSLLFVLRFWGIARASGDLRIWSTWIRQPKSLSLLQPKVT